MMEIESGKDCLIWMEHISTRFGTIAALTDVSFGVDRGEVRALLGDNGAGKSTLIKVLMGLYPPTAGQIFIDGKPVTIHSPSEARNMGIEAVYQDLALVNLMSITRNFFLGREMVKHLGPISWLDMRQMNDLCRSALHDIGIDIRSATERVGSLSGGERQSIAIGR